MNALLFTLILALGIGLGIAAGFLFVVALWKALRLNITVEEQEEECCVDFPPPDVFLLMQEAVMDDGPCDCGCEEQEAMKQAEKAKGHMVKVKPEQPWAKKHDCCKGCKTTDKPHQARGYCHACYQDKFVRPFRKYRQ